MHSFLALYRGDTIGSARLIAVSTDPVFVAEFADHLLAQSDADVKGDPVVEQIRQGRRLAVQLVKREVIEDE